MSTRQQGTWGELEAARWFAHQGYTVWGSLFQNDPYADLIVTRADEVLRVQVKTCTFCRRGRWDVTLCTRGGNQSWNGLVKTLDRTRFDYLFVLTGDDRCWVVPSTEVDGRTGIRLGGPKYARFEVEGVQ